jgi:hypothetical protein
MLDAPSRSAHAGVTDRPSVTATSRTRHREPRAVRFPFSRFNNDQSLARLHPSPGLTSTRTTLPGIGETTRCGPVSEHRSPPCSGAERAGRPDLHWDDPPIEMHIEVARGPAFAVSAARLRRECGVDRSHEAPHAKLTSIETTESLMRRVDDGRPSRSTQDAALANDADGAVCRRRRPRKSSQRFHAAGVAPAAYRRRTRRWPPAW